MWCLLLACLQREGVVARAGLSSAAGFLYTELEQVTFARHLVRVGITDLPAGVEERQCNEDGYDSQDHVFLPEHVSRSRRNTAIWVRVARLRWRLMVCC